MYINVTDFLETSKEDELAILYADFLNETNFFQWVLDISHGVDKSTGLPDYSVWWDDIALIKRGDTIIARHLPNGGGHNIMIPTGEILNQAIAGYLLTGDAAMKKVVELFSKGVTATMKGMLWDENDNEKYIMARNIIPESHSFETKNGKKVVDYSAWRNPKKEWNAQRIHFPDNPYWGDIYVTNMRSKDDLPHILRAAAYMPDVAFKVESAKECYHYLEGFCQDIADNGYKIRTKNESGKPYFPKQDLASFVKYKILPRAETNARLTISLLGYGENQGIHWRDGDGGLYERIAVSRHYYNYKIINGFHMTAILHAFNSGEDDIAEALLRGLQKRAEKLMKSDMTRSDLAVFLLKAASVGLSLSQEQVKVIRDEFLKAINYHRKFSRWDLRDENIPDGTYGPLGGYKPFREDIIRIEELGFLLEYCYSPYKRTNDIINPDLIKLSIHPSF